MNMFFKTVFLSLLMLSSQLAYAQDNVIEGVFTASFTGVSFGNEETRNYTSNSFQLIEGHSSFSNPTLNFRFFTIFAPGASAPFGVSDFNLDFGNNNTFSNTGGPAGITDSSYRSFSRVFYESTSFFGTGVFANAVVDTQFYGWQEESFMRWTDSIATSQPAGPISGTSSIRMRFNFTTPIPEPDSYAMFLAGLGLIGLVRRFKK